MERGPLWFPATTGDICSSNSLKKGKNLPKSKKKMGKVSCKGWWEHVQGWVCVCRRTNPTVIYLCPWWEVSPSCPPCQALLDPVKLQRAKPSLGADKPRAEPAHPDSPAPPRPKITHSKPVFRENIEKTQNLSASLPHLWSVEPSQVSVAPFSWAESIRAAPDCQKKRVRNQSFWEEIYLPRQSIGYRNYIKNFSWKERPPLNQ